MWNRHPPRFFWVLELDVGTFGVDHEPVVFFESADNVPAFHVCMNTHFESCPSGNGRKKAPSPRFRYRVATWTAGQVQPVPRHVSGRGLGFPGDAGPDPLAGWALIKISRSARKADERLRMTSCPSGNFRGSASQLRHSYRARNRSRVRAFFAVIAAVLRSSRV